MRRLYLHPSITFGRIMEIAKQHAMTLEMDEQNRFVLKPAPAGSREVGQPAAGRRTIVRYHDCSAAIGVAFRWEGSERLPFFLDAHETTEISECPGCGEPLATAWARGELHAEQPERHTV